MKTLLRILILLLPFFWSIYVLAQSGGNAACSTCFTTEVVSVEPISDECTAYRWRVSFDSQCKHALSHFAVEIPCGTISDLANSEGWKQEFGLDPTSGLRGFKIDDIEGFGKGSLTSFTIDFVWCYTEEQCPSFENCWQPIVAYKAGTCVDYDTLSAACAGLSAALTKQDVSCYGANDGKLTVDVTQGVSPFAYLWSNGSVEQSIGDLGPGAYSVIVRDATGAEVVLSDTIHQPSSINIESVSNATDCAGANGTIDVTVSGGAGGYIFEWSDGGSGEDRQHMAAGNYTLTVTDEIGCSAQAAVTVEQSATISIDGVVGHATCDLTDGSIDITVTGGTAPYDYEWSTNEFTEDISGLAGGTYEVTVTDSVGCSATKRFDVKASNPLRLTFVTTPTNCDSATGTIDISVIGGTEPYTFTWSNGSSKEDLEGLDEGQYTVVIEDANGCTYTRTISIKKESFALEAEVTKPTCFGGSGGSISLDDPISGDPPYHYEWSNGETGSEIGGLPAGMYSVVVTDSSGCSAQMSFYVGNPPGITASHSITNDECGADGSFDVDIAIEGGAGGYTVVWPDGVITEDREDLFGGSYLIVISDSLGCSIDYEFEIDAVDDEVGCNIMPLDSMPVCGSQGNALMAAVSDAESYSWTVQSDDPGWQITGDTTTATITYTTGGVGSGATFVLIVAKNGCSSSCSYEVTACLEDTNPGEGEPGDGEPGDGEAGSGDDDCGSCFETELRWIGTDGSCDAYEAIVSTDGSCRYELSHWSMEVPCGTIRDIKTSTGWDVEIGMDPTTGIAGFKVDNIDGFGKTPDSFTVQFVICRSGSCSDWGPRVAYKAGRCVDYDTLDTPASAAISLTAYPNPFREGVIFEWTPDVDEYTVLEILDPFGHRVGIVYGGMARKGVAHKAEFSGITLNSGLYYYRMTAGEKVVRGKLFRR